jgi:urea transport system ATP-binding protein
MTEAATILSVESLEVSYGPTQVLFGVSLEVPEGGLCCLMGRNGVGKTTLLQAIVGLQQPRRGTISLYGQPITKAAPFNRVKAGIAYVPQGREAFPYLTVYDNLRVVAEASSTGTDAIEEALGYFPRLRKLLDRPAGFLSGGEAQQLAIARALVTKPKLLLLDEPTEGIQPSIILEIEDVIAALKQSAGMSILLVEQYVDFAMRLADTYAVMDVGRIVSEGDIGTFERERVQELLAV